MEPDLASDMAKPIEKKSVQVAVLVGDDDSSTIKKVREIVNHDVQKWSDVAEMLIIFVLILKCYYFSISLKTIIKYE